MQRANNIVGYSVACNLDRCELRGFTELIINQHSILRYKI